MPLLLLAPEWKSPEGSSFWRMPGDLSGPRSLSRDLPIVPYLLLKYFFFSVQVTNFSLFYLMFSASNPSLLASPRFRKPWPDINTCLFPVHLPYVIASFFFFPDIVNVPSLYVDHGGGYEDSLPLSNFLFSVSCCQARPEVFYFLLFFFPNTIFFKVFSYRALPL